MENQNSLANGNVCDGDGSESGSVFHFCVWINVPSCVSVCVPASERMSE